MVRRRSVRSLFPFSFISSWSSRKAWKSLHFVVIFVFFYFLSFFFLLDFEISNNSIHRFLTSKLKEQNETQTKLLVVAVVVLLTKDICTMKLNTFLTWRHFSTFHCFRFCATMLSSSWSWTNESVLNSDLFEFDKFITLMFPGI